MNTARWIVAAPLLFLGAWVILYHWRLVILFVRVRFFGRSHKSESSVPLFGPVCVCAGSFVAPGPELLRYAWLSFLGDPATYLLLVSIPFLFREFTSARKSRQ